MRLPILKLLIAVGVVGCCGSFSSAESVPQVSVNTNAAGTETEYRIASESCQIKWTLDHSKLNEGIIVHRSACTLPMSQQMPLIAKLLGKVLASNGNAGTIRTLSLGRLNAYPEMSERLATLASRSPLWNRRTGRPTSGNVNTFVAKLANQQPIYAEWQTMFEQFDRRIEIAGVEKVLVSRARDLPFFKQVHAQGTTASDKLPYDCLVWFSVRQRDGHGRN